jgi:hypothetical protein
VPRWRRNSAAARGAAALLCIATISIAATPACAQDFATELATLTQSEAELPRLDLTPPIHRQLVCITLETLVDFARRVDTHMSRCPSSAYQEKAGHWVKARREYATRFRQHHCRPSL